MPDIRIPLNDKSILQLPDASDGQYKARDREVRGFYLLVGKKRRTFMVQGDIRKDGKRVASIKVVVGDASDMTATKARGIAKRYLIDIGEGRHPKPEKVRAETAAAEVVASALQAESGEPPEAAITLRVAWERYLTSHLIRKERSEGTISGYTDHVERVFKEWLDTPLKELADEPDRVAQKHDAITKESGPYGANGAMRTLRAIYNHARNKNRKLLPRDNPVDAVDWNPEERRNTAMGAKDLKGWFDELAAMDNPIRREFHLFTLLSGSRPTALKKARVAHLDLRRRVLHIPSPKGGKKRAFDIPLSRQMIGCLIRAMRYGRFRHAVEAQTWIFPADSKSGHLEEHKENRTEGPKMASQAGVARERAMLSKWGNDLRQTYRTLATVAKVSGVDAKLLMNHAIPGVNEGYITREKLVEDHLRAQQQAIADIMFKPVIGELGRPNALRAWLGPRATRKAIEAAAATETKKASKTSDTTRALAA